MKCISIMYHDVVDGSDWNTSGFATPEAAFYKLNRLQFSSHLNAISRAVEGGPASIDTLRERVSSRTTVLLTFDDGGVAAVTHIAGELERMGWRGHFFITTGKIGTPGFMNAGQIRELHTRGHIIGSHSHSHPARMSHESWETMLNEWDRSVRALADIIGEPIRCASLPGGYYSREVADTASIAGIEMLFTSEPTIRSYRVRDCLVLGRYAVRRWTSAETAAAIASGRFLPRMRQQLAWNASKTIKKLGGSQYLKLRESIAREVV
jgi:peptidoglycan/xylan/chitin deacetylase (PgdA/CDA1 family)